MNDYSPRRSAVLSSLVDREGGGVEGLLVTSRYNVRYLTGFTGTNGWFLLTTDGHVFLTDPRYEEQARLQVRDVDVEIFGDGLDAGVAAVLRCCSDRRIGFESGDVTVALAAKLRAAADVEWVACEGAVEAIRRNKQAEEVEAIGRALALTEDALAEVAASIAPGQSEVEVAAELEHACRRRGAEGMAFETIVASGPRSALPHGVATERVIGAEEPVMIDMGCRLGGYCSDITRMVWCGASPGSRWLELYDVVDRARAAALSAVGPGVAVAEVDAVAREVIETAGFGAAFSHGTGHGVGLEIHEAPTISARSSDRLEEGMVATIEPAVYLEGEFGIRIEDMVHVGSDAPRRLTALGTEPILPKIP